jgi:hypothetical protein
MAAEKEMLENDLKEAQVVYNLKYTCNKQTHLQVSLSNCYTCSHGDGTVWAYY